MTFFVEYDTQPQKFLEKADNHIAKRIMDKLETALTENPVPHDAKTIVGEHGVFRIRIGDYRALYRINYKDKKILVFKIEARPHAY
jgi:mRNA interferase RelE/StbE